MAQSEKSIAARVENAVKAPLSDLGYDLWDVEYVKEGSEWYLRITIDSEDGVDIDDCEAAFRVIDPIVTEMDPVENAYHLEVSSPGLERSLRKREHFVSCVGQEIVLKLFAAVNGKKELKGTLVSVDEDGTLTVACPEEIRIEKNKISRANVFFDFDALDDRLDEEE